MQPDYSDQEEIIQEIGKAELLYKNGKKILRYGKHTWGTEDYSNILDFIKPYLTGRILDVGLGMGISLDKVIENDNFSEVIVYEKEIDIVSIYDNTHEPNENIDIKNEDCFQNKPDGFFDCILFELKDFIPFNYQDCKDYLNWAKDHLESGKYFIMDYSKASESLANEFTDHFNLSYITNGLRLGRETLWIVMVRK